MKRLVVCLLMVCLLGSGLPVRAQEAEVSQGDLERIEEQVNVIEQRQEQQLFLAWLTAAVAVVTSIVVVDRVKSGSR